MAGLGPTLIGTGFLLRQFTRTTWGVAGSAFVRLRNLVLYVFAVGTATAINSFLVGYAILVYWAIIIALSDPSGWNAD